MMFPIVITKVPNINNPTAITVSDFARMPSPVKGILPPCSSKLPGCGFQVRLAGAVKSGSIPVLRVSVDVDSGTAGVDWVAPSASSRPVDVWGISEPSVVDGGVWVMSKLDAWTMLGAGADDVVHPADVKAAKADVILGNSVDETSPDMLKSRRLAHVEGSSPFTFY